jgi:electron transport complex protein RnfB
VNLSQSILDALPQTQCTRCGYPDCASYANAIASREADINQCPPGGQEGVRRLSDITGRPYLPLNPEFGKESPRSVAWIDEQWCIGCTLCIPECPTDAIIGSNKQMHTIIEEECTGCERCLSVCPVDCIHLENTSGTASGWNAWSEKLASHARFRYEQKTQRTANTIAKTPAKTDTTIQKKSAVQAALERAKALEHPKL